MKLAKTDVDHLDLAFEAPQPGVSILQFEEGIQKRTNEKSGKTTLQLPFMIDRVVEGPDENQGKKLSHFVPVETEFGEKQLAGILTLTGLIDGFTQKFGEDVDVNSDQFINALKLKLPGKFIKAHHESRKDQAGKDRANITKFERFKSSGPAKAGTTNGGKQPEADW
jgi:hypothetical protein